MRLMKVEAVKLLAQPRLRAAAAVCALGPVVLAIVLGAGSGLPTDTLLGRQVRSSGLALPLFVLGFAGMWTLPLLASFVVGDLFAAEDGLRTWQLLLSRSRRRGEVFRAKLVVGAGAVLLLLAVAASSCTAAGVALGGWRPLTALSGDQLAPAHALVVVAASWLSTVPPLLVFCSLACLLAVLTGNALVAVGGPLVIGLVLQLVALVGSLGRAANALPTTPFAAWHGLVRSSAYDGPLWQGALVSLAWTAAFLVPAWLVFSRKDIA